jgi:hypothetical protein
MKTNTRTLVAGTILTLIFITQVPTTYAQSPEFTYQGQLTINGVPVAGAYDFEFRLFDDPTAGTQLSGADNLEDIEVVGGVFTVTLDFGDTSFGGSPRWLEIAVRPGASTNGYAKLSPRQPITATPYAIQSASAGSAEFLSGTISAAQLTGTISPNQIGAGTITGDKLANGAVTSSHLAPGAVTSAALANGAVGSNHLSAGAVTTTALADNAITAGKVYSALSLLSTTVITNPTPLALDQFGSAVAVAGTDRILVGANLDDAGATNAGAAYLFDIAGNLLVTLNNPSPAAEDNFGFAVAAVGSDKLLVGAYQDDTGALNAGSAYLFNTSGALLLTLTNPSPSIADIFGQAVTAIGSERLVIAAPNDSAGAGQFGTVYLYDVGGNLTLTITNPTPANLDSFGTALVAAGVDKLLIGASNDDVGANNSGVAYLYSTNGTLLTTITNPSPAVGDNFGSEVIAVGTDKVLITAPSDDTGATDAGAAYLFDLTGTLLVTLTNPAPANGDGFGSTAAVVGADRVLIGAVTDDTGAANAGSAYLFDLAGNLILTFTNPAPGSADLFGSAVAALDSKRIVVGARQDDRGINDAGAVFVMSFDTFTPGLVADAVRAGGVDSTSIAVGAVRSVQIADGAVTANKVATSSNWFALSLPNPTPAPSDLFGISVAGVGTDETIIGDSANNTAYLFSIDGTLLTTFTNPTAGGFDGFGSSVAAVGEECVLIGASSADLGPFNSGVAYLFNTAGALLTTFTNPTPADSDYFGNAVAAMGNDRVLIGAYRDNAGVLEAGSVHLFMTNGTLLTTFTNPTPADFDSFGSALTAVGPDRVLVGASGDDTGTNNVGAAYLFNTNGALLVTFTNPTPAANVSFGQSVAAAGTDRVLIAAPGDDTGADRAGVVHLFSTNGTLLTTFVNPAPAVGDNFGWAMAMVGSDRVIISAYLDDEGATNAGRAYLFGLNGTLLATLTNPAPATGDQFGYCVAAVGSERVVVGVPFDNSGLSDGAAYLFSVEKFATGLAVGAAPPGAITASSLADGSVTASKLHPSVGLWARAGDNVYRAAGNVGINTATPATTLDVNGNLNVADVLSIRRTSAGISPEGSLYSINSSYVRLSTSTSVTMNPTNAIPDGDRQGALLLLEGSQFGSVTFTNGANVRLAAPIRVLGPNDVLTLLWNGFDWLEISFADN